uniref:Isochorismatase domain-containing protein 1 n=1 Tax=Triatoma infestans TaxID=30076 RepID=A0A170ZTH4_TRIIF
MKMSSTIVKFGFLPVKRTVFLLCDVQEKFRTAAMYFQEIIQSSNKLLQASKILDIPLVVTEQYPKGLGRTVEELDIAHAKSSFLQNKITVWLRRISIKNWIHYAMAMYNVLYCLVLRLMYALSKAPQNCVHLVYKCM